MAAAWSTHATGAEASGTAWAESTRTTLAGAEALSGAKCPARLVVVMVVLTTLEEVFITSHVSCSFLYQDGSKIYLDESLVKLNLQGLRRSADVQLVPAYPIATNRLLIRPLTAADVDDVVAYRSIPDVCRYVPFKPMNAEAITDRLRGNWSRLNLLAEGEYLTLGVELVEAGRVIGDMFLAFQSEENRGAEIGWVLSPAHSGHGYATEASHAILHLAFDQLGAHRVIARVDARNEASLRLADRLGMRREAHLISNDWFKGEWSDEIDFALLEHDWAQLHPQGPRSCRWPLAVPQASPAD